MNDFPDKLSERLLSLSIHIIKIEKQLCKTYSGRHIYGQLFRAGTSAGANFEEARAAESKADFIHKMQIVLKELREAHFWIKLVITSKLISIDEDALHFIYNESKELANITAKSVVTVKSKTIKVSSNL